MQPSASLADKEAGTKKSSCARYSQATIWQTSVRKYLSGTRSRSMWKNLGCVRFDQESQGTLGRVGVCTDTATSTSALSCHQSSPYRLYGKEEKTLLQVELDRERPHLFSYDACLGGKSTVRPLPLQRSQGHDNDRNSQEVMCRLTAPVFAD